MAYKHIKEYRKRFKNKIVTMMGGKCMVCGYNRCIKALELHHTNPSKKDFCISQMTTLNWNIIFQEASKCVLVCANCHREIHDEIIKCPKLKNIKFSKLSDYFIDWDKFDLENDVKTLSAREISKKYNITKTSVHRKCNELGLNLIRDLKFNVSNEELQKLVLEMPLESIGKMYNVTGNAIKKRCIKLGIKLPNKGRGYWTKIKYSKNT